MVTLHDIMTVDVVTVGPDDTLREIADLLTSEHISGVPVVDGEDVVGVVSATDLLEFDAAVEGGESPGGEEWQLGFEDQPGTELWEEGEEPPAAYFARLWEHQDAMMDKEELTAPAAEREGDAMDRYTAADVMTRTLCALPSDATAREAAEYMLRAHIHRVLVIDDDRLVGVVTTTDLMKAVSQHGLAG